MNHRTATKSKDRSLRQLLQRSV